MLSESTKGLVVDESSAFVLECYYTIWGVEKNEDFYCVGDCCVR
jgi:hypothetical protein